jgi:hypothetical protein
MCEVHVGLWHKTSEIHVSRQDHPLFHLFCEIEMVWEHIGVEIVWEDLGQQWANFHFNKLRLSDFNCVWISRTF